MAEQRPACTQQRYQIKSTDLPLSCPLPDMPAWNAHPRVYLPIEDNGEVRCPYCGAIFVLEDD